MLGNITWYYRNLVNIFVTVATWYILQKRVSESIGWALLVFFVSDYSTWAVYLLHLIKIFFASISILRVDGGVSNEDILTPQTFSVTFLPTSCAVFLYRVRKKLWLVNSNRLNEICVNCNKFQWSLM